MKRVKFRFWDKELKELKYLDLEDLCEDDYWFDGETSVWEVLHDSNTEQERFICMQYTGIKDKTEKEIYEGDIVFANSHGSLSSLTPNGENIIGEVYYTEGCFCIGCSENKSGNLIPLCIYEISILGNIHENSDLLKGEQ